MFKMTFSQRNSNVTDEKMEKLIQVGVDLAKHALNTETRSNFLINEQTGMTFSNTDNDNAEFLREYYNYCADVSPVLYNMPGLSKDVDGKIDWNNLKNLSIAFSDTVFKQMYFAVQIEILQQINSKTEVEDIMMACNVSYVALGDSQTFEIDPIALYKIQENGYGGLYSVYQEMLRSSETLVPRQKNASISFNVMQMLQKYSGGDNHMSGGGRIRAQCEMRSVLDKWPCSGILYDLYNEWQGP